MTIGGEAGWGRQGAGGRGAWGDQGNGRFRNPLIWADYGHPCLLQHGDDFYMVAAAPLVVGMPILHSRDLINWSLLARVATAPDEGSVGRPGWPGGQGCATSSITYHDGRFWIYYADPHGGLFVTTASDPAGPWDHAAPVHDALACADPYPFWDDDGQAYLLHSRSGESPLILQPMRADGRALLGDGAVLDDTRPNAHCPFLFKRKGYYYLLTTGAWHRSHGSGYAVIVYRSSNLYGPYEHRVILGTSGAGRSLGGGGWAEHPAGQYWFLHDMGLPGQGRLPFLEPAGWQGDWPWISQGNSEIGAGWPTWENAKPNSGVREAISLPAASDEFAVAEPGPQWLWDHDAGPALWSLSERQGFLRLRATTLQPADGGEQRTLAAGRGSPLRARTVLAQLIMGKRCRATTVMDVSQMAEGQRAGLGLFNRDDAWIGVVQEHGRRMVQASVPDGSVEGPPITQQMIRLRAVCDEGTGSLFYSLDGETYLALGEPFALQEQGAEAHKLALFTYNVEAGRGLVDFDWFHLEHDGPIVPS